MLGGGDPAGRLSSFAELDLWMKKDMVVWLVALVGAFELGARWECQQAQDLPDLASGLLRGWHNAAVCKFCCMWTLHLADDDPACRRTCW